MANYFFRGEESVIALCMTNKAVATNHGIYQKVSYLLQANKHFLTMYVFFAI